MSTTLVPNAPSPSQLGWIRALLFERGIEMEPEDVARTASEASAFIKRCLAGQIGTVQPISDDQAETIRALQAELGPRPDGEEQELPDDRAGANRLIRALQQVKFARAEDTVLSRLEALGVSVTRPESTDTQDEPELDEIPL